mmetsp:Transcript_26504/g.85645  ORF Transcript_26504/g.85645 Transcript_26504/m.85645 type:complete len:225 (-) Transcript_26504:32-706(-)
MYSAIPPCRCQPYALRNLSLVHDIMKPRRQSLHRPQPEMWYTITRSPFLNRRKPGPSATICPQGSCPAMHPWYPSAPLPRCSRKMQRMSLPQMVLTFVLIKTSPCPGFGTSKSSMSTWLLPGKTAPRIFVGMTSVPVRLDAPIGCAKQARISGQVNHVSEAAQSRPGWCQLAVVDRVCQLALSRDWAQTIGLPRGDPTKKHKGCSASSVHLTGRLGWGNRHFLL